MRAVQGLRALPWLLLCACGPSAAPSVEVVLEPGGEARPPIRDAPLDPETAALLGAEALAAAGRPVEPISDSRTPAERAQQICEDRCAKSFDRAAMIRRIVYARPSSGDLEHAPAPDLQTEDGWQRFVDGEASTIWYLEGDHRDPGSYAYALYINPELERATFPFSGLLFEIDTDGRVVRCRYAERDEPDAAVEMTCSRRSG